MTLNITAVLCGAIMDTPPGLLSMQHLPLQTTKHTETCQLLAVLDISAGPQKKLQMTTVLPNLNLTASTVWVPSARLQDPRAAQVLPVQRRAGLLKGNLPDGKPGGAQRLHCAVDEKLPGRHEVPQAAHKVQVVATLPAEGETPLPAQ